MSNFDVVEAMKSTNKTTYHAGKDHVPYID